MTDNRSTIFVSHATPGDNIFATWLGSRLGMAGYDVWCDQQKLIGGEDFWQDIENVLRNKTKKFVLVVSSNAFDENGRLRDGIAKELAVANILKKQLGDDYFIIPIRIDGTKFSDFSIDFVRLNGVDCATNWASGLNALLKALERDEVPRKGGFSTASLTAWRTVHQFHSRSLVTGKEQLQSNWLEIESFPNKIHFYEILKPIKSSEPRSIASTCAIPCFDHGRLLGCFAELYEIQSELGETIPVKYRASILTSEFLAGTTGELPSIKPRDAKNKLTSLVRQAWDAALQHRGLLSYEMANQNIAWWFSDAIPEDGQLRYTDFNGKPRRRAVSGTRGKKENTDGSISARYHWHLGFTGKPFLGDLPVIVLQPRIIISEDGKTPLENKTKLNSVRRSLTNMWFNEKWRGLIMGFSSWLADGNEKSYLPVGSGHSIGVGARPLMFLSDVQVQSDPILKYLSEQEEELHEKSEIHMKINDPAFVFREDDLGIL